jgi:hypothetical protein
MISPFFFQRFTLQSYKKYLKYPNFRRKKCGLGAHFVLFCAILCTFTGVLVSFFGPVDVVEIA